eukprot:2978986-Rhodomonas_salina.1
MASGACKRQRRYVRNGRQRTECAASHRRVKRRKARLQYTWEQARGFLRLRSERLQRGARATIRTRSYY